MHMMSVNRVSCFVGRWLEETDVSNENEEMSFRTGRPFRLGLLDSKSERSQPLLLQLLFLRRWQT